MKEAEERKEDERKRGGEGEERGKRRKGRREGRRKREGKTGLWTLDPGG